MNGTSAEQQARDLLERLEVEDAQTYSAGELVELAIDEGAIDRSDLDDLIACLVAVRDGRQANP